MMKKSYSYDDLIRIYKDARSRASSFNNIPADLFLTKPGSKSWSIAEICSHIVQFNELYLEEMNAALENSRKTEDPGKSFTPGFLARKYAGHLEPPYKFKLKTIKPFYPDSAEELTEQSETVRKLTSVQDKTLSFLRSCKSDGIDADRTKGRNPVLKFLPMSLAEFLILMDAHQRRHFWQIEQTEKRLAK
jgi:uncharacterized damage-inducible protein DinB